MQMTGYFSDNTDPTSYYYCDRSGTGTKLTCPDKYEWNQYELSCVKASFNKVHPIFFRCYEAFLKEVISVLFDCVDKP